ncbi:hypothetical protein F9U64_10520 [Gracilibacillus oryzae]|uniref:DUF3784 domain-containing protein n=1 Tax=Gracilibacillus oryzae TaxID=1672701 RepID=A0A7C8GU33_9BACI|nr:hypothetical protein [Gracilibacillus oryzae]KAB8135704.1 hypothetical protein F9U64_10520 [Gracilibacillus oryzae]
MFAQLFLGIAMIVHGTCHLLDKRIFLRKNIESYVSDVRSYQKGAALSAFLLGFLFIVMGLVEKLANIPTTTFIIIYIILAAIPLTIAIVNNKKHSGYYWL